MLLANSHLLHEDTISLLGEAFMADLIWECYITPSNHSKAILTVGAFFFKVNEGSIKSDHYSNGQSRPKHPHQKYSLHCTRIQHLFEDKATYTVKLFNNYHNIIKKYFEMIPAKTSNSYHLYRAPG